MIGRLLRWARRRSPWVLHFNSGGCNGCDIEILDLLTPRYDVERLGIVKEASPRHADILLCTGPVTRQSRDRLRRIYEQMPEPKWVVAIGTCACSAGVFRGSYNVMGGVDQVIPVDVYIPGCPCRPEVIIAGLAKLFEKIERTNGSEALTTDPADGESADIGPVADQASAE
jgi:NADH-quinone oxidoreductase B subunit